METQWYSDAGDGRLVCELCPRACTLKDGDRGFCFVRKNVDGRMVLDTYGKSTGFCIDPIEKKPLSHFLPGTPVLSFGTAGCNLGCKFCQNWDISKSREVARLSDHAMPRDIANAAKNSGCRSVAFTYNDPVIWAEYAIDTAHACHAQGLKSVAVTAGYITEQARGDFFGAMDAANIDLKAFEEDFYFKLTGSHLQPVLDTIEFACNETDCWVELTNLIIPGANDSAAEVTRMCDWILEHVGPNVPLHFTAFHPDFRMTDRARTEHATLVMAYDIARQQGLNYVYVGNVHDANRQSTYCHECRNLLIERDWHQLGTYALSNDRCSHCNAQVPGVFESQPGDWGAKRQRIQIETSEASEIRLADPPSPQVVPLGTARNHPQSESDMNANKITELSSEQKDTIQSAACAMVQTAVDGGDPSEKIAELGELAELPVDGVFVTAKRGETLRGCCGKQGAPMKLGAAMAESAGRTARDPRMAPLSASELPFLDLSVSLLGPLRPIGVSGDQCEAAVKVGEHGLRIQLGQSGGLLLPQVAVEQGWNSRQFLDAVCRKAGLPAGTWRHPDAKLMLFDGVCFGESFEIQSATPGLVSKTLMTKPELLSCRNWIHNNLVAMQSGATPMYYATGVPDLEILGLVLSVSHPQLGQQQWLHLSIRESRPMQSTLYQMTGQAAQWLGQRAPASECSIDVALLDDCVHHGEADAADVRGIDLESRVVVLTDGRRWSVAHGSDGEVKSAIDAARQLESFRGNEQLYSMHCESSSPSVSISVGPRADASITTRRPAVAGRFYPAEDASREAEVDRMIGGLPDYEKRPAFAVMVPHAGLRFSGRIAGDVWRRLELPKRVLVIGPKHTNDGADWAIAPHDRWLMSPAATISGDADTARELSDRLPMMELDSVAHGREHGIEIQLPFLYRYCPDVKLTAIAMHGGSTQMLDELAQALADWIKEQEEPPLLVISSDMNHYADDLENRRRDRLALDALKTGDGELLLKVCEEENISMCGQLPAAVVMMVMRKLGLDLPADEIGYATSAEFGGDTERVVGYSGVVWWKEE